jgi:hypothetical protein
MTPQRYFCQGDDCPGLLRPAPHSIRCLGSEQRQDAGCYAHVEPAPDKRDPLTRLRVVVSDLRALADQSNELLELLR